MTFKLGQVLKSTPEILRRRDRCPTGKTAFSTKREAAAALKKINHTHRTQMKEFRCGFCEKWHLGHRRGAVT